MDADVPVWPLRLTRKEARLAKARRKAFDLALKAGAKADGWRYANGGLFRQHGDWFVSVRAFPLWERGAGVTIDVKPMAIDPLFWSIVGLSENERLPLSFRANGAWVLRSPGRQDHVGLRETDPEQLARAVLDWSAERLSRVAASSVESMLADLEGLGPIRANFAALEICLHLLNDDTDRALALCRDRGPFECGGFTTGSRTFFDQARDWIVDLRRGRMAAV